MAPRLPEPLAPAWSLVGHGYRLPIANWRGGRPTLFVGQEPRELGEPTMRRGPDLIPGVLGQVDGFQFYETGLTPVVAPGGTWSFSNLMDPRSWS